MLFLIAKQKPLLVASKSALDCEQRGTQITYIDLPNPSPPDPEQQAIVTVEVCDDGVTDETMTKRVMRKKSKRK
jgi:hypothetical protein